MYRSNWRGSYREVLSLLAAAYELLRPKPRRSLQMITFDTGDPDGVHEPFSMVHIRSGAYKCLLFSSLDCNLIGADENVH